MQLSRRFFPDNSLSKDVANDIYLKLFNQKTDRLLRMIYKGEFQSFIYVCIKNHSIDIHNSCKNRTEAEHDSALIEYGEVINDDELQERLSKLSDEEKKIISIFVNRKTQQDVAKELNVSREFINRKLNKIRKL